MFEFAVVLGAVAFVVGGFFVAHLMDEREKTKARKREARKKDIHEHLEKMTEQRIRLKKEEEMKEEEKDRIKKQCLEEIHKLPEMICKKEGAFSVTIDKILLGESFSIFRMEVKKINDSSITKTTKQYSMDILNDGSVVIKEGNTISMTYQTGILAASLEKG